MGGGKGGRTAVGGWWEGSWSRVVGGSLECWGWRGGCLIDGVRSGLPNVLMYTGVGQNICPSLHGSSFARIPITNHRRRAPLNEPKMAKSLLEQI